MTGASNGAPSEALARERQGLDNELIVRGPPAEPPPDGVIKSYRRAAA